MIRGRRLFRSEGSIWMVHVQEVSDENITSDTSFMDSLIQSGDSNLKNCTVPTTAKKRKH